MNKKFEKFLESLKGDNEILIEAIQKGYKSIFENGVVAETSNLVTRLDDIINEVNKFKDDIHNAKSIDELINRSVELFSSYEEGEKGSFFKNANNIVNLAESLKHYLKSIGTFDRNPPPPRKPNRRKLREWKEQLNEEKLKEKMVEFPT